MRRNWGPLSASAAVHVLLIAAAVALSRRQAEGPPERKTDPTTTAKRVEMIYIPPAEPARRPRPPQPASPPPVAAQKKPEPEPNALPEARRAEGTESEKADAMSRPAPTPPTAPAPQVATTATLESEARRIFGRPRPRTPPGAGPQAIRPMEAYLPDNSERCVPDPPDATDSSSAPRLGTVVGRIYKQDSGRPLAGAHLQMLGAPYVAFTDNNGEYRFRFDMSLVDNCRTQYVRVTAPGYESRLLVLVVGENIQSEDVRLRRR